MASHPAAIGRASAAAAILFALAWAASACVAPEVQVSTTATHSAVRPGARDGAPIGTVLVVQLVDALDSATSHVGQSFEARVVERVVGTDRTVVVEAGAGLRGHVTSVGTRGAPRLRLALDAVDTLAGPSPVVARIRRAQRVEYPGPERVDRDRVDSLCDAPPSPKTESDPFCGSYVNLLRSDTAPEHGFGETPPTDDRPTEVHLAPGARIELVLTQPLVLQRAP
jgi:hypothetical protein